MGSVLVTGWAADADRARKEAARHKATYGQPRETTQPPYCTANKRLPTASPTKAGRPHHHKAATVCLSHLYRSEVRSTTDAVPADHENTDNEINV